MRRSVTVFSLMTLGLMASASIQDASTLRYTLVEGNVDKYAVKINVVQNVDVPQMGTMDMNIDMGYNYAVTVGKVDAASGKADVEFKTSDIVMKMSGALADMMAGQGAPPAKDTIQKAKMDNRYRISDMKMGAMSPEMMLSMGSSSSLSFFIELPENAVRAGDAITVSIAPTPMLGNKEAIKLNGKFLGEATADGVTGYKLEVAGTIPLNLDMAALMEEMAKQNPGADPSGGMMAGMKMFMKGTMDLKQTAIIDKATSRVLWGSSVMTTKATTEMPDMGMSIPTAGTVKMTLKLVK